MSYESEERYWTDYLRVALPVIGLLLMLALFWWWAQNFIGDETDPGTVAQATQTEIATVNPPTPTNTIEASVVVTEQQAATPPGNGGSDGKTPDNRPTEPPDCGFALGDLVVVNDDDVNLRAEPSTAEDVVIVEKVSKGTEFQIVSDCYEKEGDNQFWQVENTETSDEGWIAAQFLDPADQ
jgi:hypothetical protein